MRRFRTVSVAVILLIVGVVFASAFVVSRARRVSDVHGMTANALLLSKALRDHEQRTGGLPLVLEELVMEDGDVLPGYLHALTNKFTVTYSPPPGFTPAKTTILSLVGNHYSVTVSRDFKVHVAK